jgi:hypothetical protein
MTYFKINGVDFSQYVNKLNVQTNHVYNARTNARGDKKVKLINTKKIVSVGIIALSEETNAELLELLNLFEVRISFRDPSTKALKEATCIIPKNNIDYYTIRADKVLTKAYTLTFEEL